MLSLLRLKLDECYDERWRIEASLIAAQDEGAHDAVSMHLASLQHIKSEIHRLEHEMKREAA